MPISLHGNVRVAATRIAARAASALLLLLLAAAPLAAQKDYYKLDRNRPTTITGAYTTERYAIEAKLAPLRLERERGGVYHWGFDPEIAYGILPRTSIEVGWEIAPDMPGFQFIETPDALRQFLADTTDSDSIALDTEFIREKTYYPKLCLIQVATDSAIACIDPLALEHLEPLWERLEDPRTTILLHAGRQDLEVIFQASGRIPAPSARGL
jgi:hypothetical protein